MNHTASHLTSERLSKGFYKVGSFYRKKSMEQGSINKSKELFLVWETFSLGEEKGKGFNHADSLFLHWGIEGTHAERLLYRCLTRKFQTS